MKRPPATSAAIGSMAAPAGRRVAPPIPAAVVFDVDGTLLTTGGAGTRSWRWAFEQLHGVAADIGRYSEAGMTDPIVGRRTFEGALGREPTDGELARLMQRYLERLPIEVRSSEGYRVLPGAHELLRRLHARGFPLGIVTGALEAAARIKLGRARLDRWFTFGGFGSDTEDRIELTRIAIVRAGIELGRPIEAAEVYAVGDTPEDVRAALGAGAVAVAVASGKYRADDLRRAGADVVLASLEDAIPWFDAITPLSPPPRRTTMSP